MELKLERMSFEDVLKRVKIATKGDQFPAGIPIYVDPIGLQEAEKTLISPVTLVTRGKPLRDGLRTALQPLGLTFVVKDGLLTITTADEVDRTLPPSTKTKDEQPAK